MKIQGWSARARAAVRAVWVCGLVLAAGVSTAAPQLADFFKPEAYADIRLSPSGKRLAATIPSTTGRRSLAVVDLVDPSKSKVVASYSDRDIWGVQWVNDERLVFHLYDQQRPLAQQRGVGLFAVDADGKDAPRILILPQWYEVREGGHIVERTLTPDHRLYRTLRDGSDDVLILKYAYEENGRDLSHVNLLRLNTRTGVVRSLSIGAPASTLGWSVDRAGQPRMLWTSQQSTESLYWKAADDAPWVKVAEGSSFEEGVPEPIYIESAQRVFARARVALRSDLVSLVVMDLSTPEKPKVTPLLTTPGFDFDGRVVRNRAGAVLGVHYLTEAPGTFWFDPMMKKIQQQVDALLPQSNNVLDCGDCEGGDNVLVTSTADRLPVTYRIFHVGKGVLDPVGTARPWLKPQEMAATDFVRVTTRDGLSMPVYVTKPNNLKEAAPAVVLVHGGPFVRGGQWEWRQEAQFLASRGYVVIEPEFRGSTGYGFKHFRAGWKQWGLAMQDDLADAALWAVKQGFVDKRRIAIAGASYGGYATLMGLVRNPEIFRCGVEWAGVTDIDLMYSVQWSDTSERSRQYGMPTLIGDPEKDAAQLAATSPIKQAARITQPLFMAHGGIDQRVPIVHGTLLRDAIGKSNPNLVWKEYAEEGHGWLLAANQIDFWTRVETFLDKNLKNAPQ